MTDELSLVRKFAFCEFYEFKKSRVFANFKTHNNFFLVIVFLTHQSPAFLQRAKWNFSDLSNSGSNLRTGRLSAVRIGLLSQVHVKTVISCTLHLNSHLCYGMIFNLAALFHTCLSRRYGKQIQFDFEHSHDMSCANAIMRICLSYFSSLASSFSDARSRLMNQTLCRAFYTFRKTFLGRLFQRTTIHTSSATSTPVFGAFDARVLQWSRKNGMTIRRKRPLKTLPNPCPRWCRLPLNTGISPPTCRE